MWDYLGIVEPWLEPMATKDSIQMRSIIKMFERVSQAKDETAYTYADTVDINYVKKTAGQQRTVQIELNQVHFFELVW